MICESTANRITNHARKANENDSFSILARVLYDFGASWEFTDNNNMILSTFFLGSNFRRDALLIAAIHDSEKQ